MIIKNYMHCSQSNFAKVYINGVYYGVFSNTESIGKNSILIISIRLGILQSNVIL